MRRVQPLMLVLAVCAACWWLAACGDDDACGFTEPRCDGNDVVVCNNGELGRTACEAGTYCNYGQCKTSAVSMPQDAAPHADPTEWWYYTGHLKDGSGGHQWGYEVTIFQYLIDAEFAYMCHVAVTDMQAAEHYHTDRFSFEPPAWSSNPIELEVEYCHFWLDGEGNDRVYGIIPDGEEKDHHPGQWVIDVRMDSRKRAALHGGDGIIPMSDAGGTSYYYSYTRLDVSGTLQTPEGDFDVTGLGWMDHQWGDFDINQFKGWDWWSMQFDGGWEIMLFQFRDWTDTLVAQAGTIIDPDGGLTELEGLDAFTITPLRHWQSTHTDGNYPLDWDIAIPDMNWQVKVVTPIDDQEMHNPAQNYWEGAVTITGTRNGADVQGVGYVELTGYATDPTDPK